MIDAEIEQLRVFCFTPRTFSEIVEKHDTGHIGTALRLAVERKVLAQSMSINGWIYSAGFPGVDIDAVHRKQEKK